jgi:hypothetical protein
MLLRCFAQFFSSFHSVTGTTFPLPNSFARERRWLESSGYFFFSDPKQTDLRALHVPLISSLRSIPLPIQHSVFRIPSHVRGDG